MQKELDKRRKYPETITSNPLGGTMTAYG